jgi:hypothetical protein
MSVSYGGDSITFADGSIVASGSQGFKNKIINGHMMIDQRYAGAANTPTSSIYTLDRWRIPTTAAKISVQQMNGANTSASNYEASSAPTGFTNSIKVTTTTANTPNAGDYFGVNQFVEGYNCADLDWGKATAKSVTLSFWVKSSLTGTFGGSIRTGDSSNYSYPFTYTISTANTWTYATVVIPGPTAGTWNTGNGQGLDVWFSVGTGSTYSGTANTWAASNYVNATGSVNVVSTLNATWYITGVQLEKGTTASSFEFRSYQKELILCQRYCVSWQNNSDIAALGTGSAYSSSAINLYAQLPVTMRTLPSATVVLYSGNWIQCYQGSSGYTSSTAPAVGDFSGNAVRLYCQGFSASFTTGYAQWCHVIRYAQLLLSAEL